MTENSENVQAAMACAAPGKTSQLSSELLSFEIDPFKQAARELLREAAGPQLPSLSQFDFTTMFMKRQSLIAQLLRLRVDLIRAQLSQNRDFPSLINQVNQMIHDVRLDRIDEVYLPGAKNARVFTLPD